MKIIESAVEAGEPTRRVTIELPESRAKVVRELLAGKLSWDLTTCEDELMILHKALGGWSA